MHHRALSIDLLLSRCIHSQRIRDFIIHLNLSILIIFNMTLFSCNSFCYDLKDTKSQRGTSLGYGKRLGTLGYTKQGPSPQQYNLPSDFTRQPKGRAFSFGLSREHFKKVYLKENPPCDISTPAPGKYNPKTDYSIKSPPKFSMRPRTAVSSSF